MNSSRFFSLALAAVLLTIPLTDSSATNGYFFEPETLRVELGTSFEWNLMVESDAVICGFGFAVDAPASGDTIFDPDTLTFYPMFIWWPPNPRFDPDEDCFGGAWTTIVCPPGLPAGTHVATTMYGTISDSAELDIYAFSGCHVEGHCDITDGTGSTFDVPVATGWMEIGWHPFIRGDVDQNENWGMLDAIFILKYLYVPGHPAPTCIDAADVDDDGIVDMTDALYTLKYLYVPGSPPPPPPFPNCGIDPTWDELGCGSYPLCE